MVVPPLLILAIGIGIVLGLIIGLRANAFLALIAAAMAVSILAPGETGIKISRVAAALGGTAGSIGIIIALASMIGHFMMLSGAADRVVNFFIRLLGEKRGGMALATSGFVLSIPVFFDTVFYLLVPLARSMHRRTRSHYLKYIMAIGAGGVVTHTLVPPTPGPLVVADTLNVNMGTMMIVGIIVGIPGTLAAMAYAAWLDRRMPVAIRPLPGESGEALPDERHLPSLFASVLPILLPIILVTAASILTTRANNERAARIDIEEIADWPGFTAALRADAGSSPASIMNQLPAAARESVASGGPLGREQQAAVIAGLDAILLKRKPAQAKMAVAIVEHQNRLAMEAAFPQIARHVWQTPRRTLANYGEFFGDPNFALLLAAIAAMGVYIRRSRPTREKVAASVEEALMSAGVIILITSAGGAFGAMLAEAQIGPAILGLFGGRGGLGGPAMLLLAFGISALIKIAQGSSTVAMITAAGMMAATLQGAGSLPFNPVYIAAAVGCGAMIGCWMNDSGFWVYCKMGGLTEPEALKSWTVMLSLCGIASMLGTLIMAAFFPMAAR